LIIYQEITRTLLKIHQEITRTFLKNYQEITRTFLKIYQGITRTFSCGLPWSITALWYRGVWGGTYYADFYFSSMILHVNLGIRRFHTITLGFIYKTSCFIYKTICFIHKTSWFINKTLCFIYKTLGFIYDESEQRILCLAIIFERLFILNNFYAYIFEIMFRTSDVQRIRFWIRIWSYALFLFWIPFIFKMEEKLAAQSCSVSFERILESFVRSADMWSNPWFYWRDIIMTKFI